MTNSNEPFDPRKVYSRQEVMATFGVSGKTLQKWKRHGLKPYQPGTKGEWYAGWELISVWQYIRDALGGDLNNEEPQNNE